MVKKWQKTNPKGIKLDNEQKITTVLLVDDQAVLAETEDDMQRAIYRLEKTSENTIRRSQGKRQRSRRSKEWYHQKRLSKEKKQDWKCIIR